MYENHPVLHHAAITLTAISLVVPLAIVAADSTQSPSQIGRAHV